MFEGVVSNGSLEQEGIVLAEEVGGGLNVRVVDSIFNSNKKYGLKVEQADGGRGRLAMIDVALVAGFGVCFDGLE